MNRSLTAKGITVRTQLTDGCLHIMLQAEFVPNQQAIVAYVTKGIKDLEVTAVKSLILYGRRQGADFPDWTERVELQQAPAASFQTVAHAEQSIDTPSGPLEATASPHKKVAVLPAISATSSLKHQKLELKWYETANSSLIIALLVLILPTGTLVHVEVWAVVIQNERDDYWRNCASTSHLGSVRTCPERCQ